MEYMRLEGFLGRAVSKLINKAIASKVGVSPNIELRDMSVETDDAEEFVKVKMTAFMPRADFEKIVEEVTK